MNISKEWEKWREIARENGIKSNTFRRRIKSGMEEKDAATKPLQHVATKIRGGLSSEDYKIAESKGISRQTAHYRYEMLFWDVETAITKQVTKKTEWEKWKWLAKENGIGYDTFRRRRVNGMNPESAATTKKGTNVGRPRKKA